MRPPSSPEVEATATARGGPRTSPGTAVGAVAAASVLVVVALWASNGNVAELGQGPGAALTSIGRLCGLVASDLLLLQVLAMARIPWVERALGQDTVARWHRLLGFTSITLMLAHALAVAVGYSLMDGIGLWPELWALVTTYPGVLLATAATALFVMIAVTSVRVARRSLRYESWHLLHLYAYLGAGLALPHQLWTGADFLASPAATAYWWTLYSLALASVLMFRIGRPLVRSRRHRLTVSEMTPEAPGVVSVLLTGPRLRELPVAAGQFFVLRFRTGPGWTRGHPFSLSAAPRPDALRFTFSVRGDDGPRLAALAPGTPVLIEGPFGRLVPSVRGKPGIVAIAGGMGITPLLSLLQDAVRRGDAQGPLTLLRRTSTSGPLPLAGDVEDLARDGGLRVVDLVGRRSVTGTSWLPVQLGHLSGPDALRALVPDLDACDVYVAGAAEWADAVAADVRAAGVPRSSLHVERFAW
ncbi:ferredoxin reductase family protein [Cellulomonas chengniuliangii]|uniref:ferredoxin reductase family protein n=1 Tax=Cellulomonas chengniuliangii TaxID=2968084 RepID=UPI001D0EC9F7|nr:ferredoxin reductase family protein [Cellulomonas chengniuliangii]MCC2316654.1 ferric reductase-like transmembrane domain-containing protein [Cellulomonas chengniuliangii]